MKRRECLQYRQQSYKNESKNEIKLKKIKKKKKNKNQNRHLKKIQYFLKISYEKRKLQRNVFVNQIFS